MAQSKTVTILIMSVALAFSVLWAYFWRYINLALNKIFRGFFCKSPGSGCNKLFDIFRFIAVWSFNFYFVFAVITLIVTIFGILSGHQPPWMKEDGPAGDKPKQQKKQQKRQQPRQKKRQKKESFLF